jgi:hypothetical protein
MSLRPYKAQIQADAGDATSPILTSYSYTIRAGNVDIGTLRTFAPSNTRAVERLREIRGNADQGIQDVIGLAPGGDEPTFRATRVELYASALLAAFGLSSIDTLNDITEPIEVQEVAISYDATGAPTSSITTYRGCVPTDWRKTIDIGTVFVVEEATFAVAEIV